MPGSAWERREDEAIAEIARDLGWEVRHPVSIWEAVPAGTPVVTASTLEDLRDRIVACRDEAAGDAG